MTTQVTSTLSQTLASDNANCPARRTGKPEPTGALDHPQGVAAARAVRGADVLHQLPRSPVSRRAPLCRAWSKSAQRDGLEIVLKGGQIGGASFFGSVKAGRDVE